MIKTLKKGGAVVDKEQTNKRFSIDLTEELYKKLKIFCVQNDVSMKEFITQAIKEKLEK